MDKNIIEALMDAGFITRRVDAAQYETIEDLFDDGVITCTGVKKEIMNIIRDLGVEPIDVNNTITEVLTDEEPLTDTPEDATETLILDTPEDVAPIDETPESETPLDSEAETPNVMEVTEDTSAAEDLTVVETKKTTKKTTKKSEE